MIHVTEILQGIRDDLQYQRTKRHLFSFPILAPKPPATFVHAADIYRTCRKAGTTIRNSLDCLIAAIAIENGVPILHNDRDFDRIASHSRLALFQSE